MLSDESTQAVDLLGCLSRRRRHRDIDAESLAEPVHVLLPILFPVRENQIRREGFDGLQVGGLGPSDDRAAISRILWVDAIAGHSHDLLSVAQSEQGLGGRRHQAHHAARGRQQWHSHAGDVRK